MCDFTKKKKSSVRIYVRTMLRN